MNGNVASQVQVNPLVSDRMNGISEEVVKCGARANIQI